MEADFVGKQIQYWAASTCRDQNTNQALVLHAKLGGLAEKGKPINSPSCW